jgi:uncharacterized protein YndB with AHSA1/START domain
MIITVQTKIHANPQDCWKCWTGPEHIMQWNNPSDEWQTANVDMDFRTGGSFLFRMGKKDGTLAFDHKGKYDKVIPDELIEYTQTDGRRSIIKFLPEGEHTILVETFEPEGQTPLDVQKDFCQGVLENFRRYVEDKLADGS